MNDSSALAAAAVGVAMGSGGCGMAVAAAGVVILSDNLLLVRPTLRIAILARQVILQNCVFAVAVKVMAIVLAILGRLGRPYSLGRSFTLLYVCGVSLCLMYVCMNVCVFHGQVDCSCGRLWWWISGRWWWWFSTDCAPCASPSPRIKKLSGVADLFI